MAHQLQLSGEGSEVLGALELLPADADARRAGRSKLAEFFFSRLIRARGGRVGEASPPCPPPDTGLSIRPAYPFLPPSKFLRGRGGARGEWVAPREELRPVGGLRPPDSGPRSCRKVAAGRGPVRRRPGPRTPRVGLSRAANLRPAAVH